MRAYPACASIAAYARRIADRKSGVGCDQVIVIEPSQRADAFMRILNADGSEVGRLRQWHALRRGAACSGIWPQRRVDRDRRRYFCAALCASGGAVTIDMGPPRLGWQDIPLARAFDDTGDARSSALMAARRACSPRPAR